LPELPEVETVRSGLANAIVGRTIRNTSIFHHRAINPKSEFDFAILEGQKVISVGRRGKFLWIRTQGSLNLVAHLGMSGQFLIQPKRKTDEVHLRARISFTKGTDELRFIDQRTFGWLAISGDGPEVPLMASHIARDLFDPEFNTKLVVESILLKKSEIKRVLLDQKVLSGIGNIYADESLWRARIHPQTAANSLTRRQLSNLLRQATAVMSEALAVGGTSFDELYVNVNGQSGYFDRTLAVYGREGEPCDRCGTPIIRISFANRSSHLCPKCQIWPAISAGGTIFENR